MPSIAKKYFFKFNASTPVSEGLALSILICLYVVFFSVVSFLKFNSFSYGDYDLAFFDQIVWNILHGSLFSSILGIVFLGNHVQLIWFLVAPFYWVFPHPMTLLFLQSLALGLAACPLYFLTKRILGPRWGVLIGAIYLTYPAVGYLNLFEFHPTAFLPLFIFSMIYYFHTQKYRFFILFMLLAVSCQENIALAALGMGFYAFCRRRSIRWVVLPIVFAVVYMWFCLRVVIPSFNENTSQFCVLYKQLGNTPAEIILNFFKHPVAVFRFMLSEPRLFYLMCLFGPLAFIPLLSPLPLLAALPLFAQHLLSSRVSQAMIQYHYTAELIPFIFVSFVFGIKTMLKAGFLYRYRGVLATALLACFLGFCYFLGPLFTLPRLAMLDYRKDAYDLEKERFLKQVPASASVVATFEFLPRLTHRSELYSFHHQYMGHYTLSTKPYSVPGSVRYCLVDFNDPLTFLTFRSFYSPDGYKNIQGLIHRGKWGVADVKDALVLFVKDADDKYVLYKILSSEPQPTHKVYGAIDQEVEFLGFDIKEEGAGSLHFSFFWKAIKKTQKDLNVFIDFIDESTRTVSAIFHPICYRIYPTIAWIPGQWVSEEAYLTIPPSLTPGHYVIKMGFFDYHTGLGYFVDPKDALGRVTLGEIDIH